MGVPKGSRLQVFPQRTGPGHAGAASRIEGDAAITNVVIVRYAAHPTVAMVSDRVLIRTPSLVTRGPVSWEGSHHPLSWRRCQRNSRRRPRTIIPAMTHSIDVLVHNAVFGDGSAKVEARKQIH